MAGYLVISRRINERISIGPNIDILIADIQQDANGELKVDIAINAPRNLGIKRRKTHAEEENFGTTIGNKSRQRHTRD